MAMAKKMAQPKNILLGNNPKLDNACRCFNKKVPSAEWIVIARYASMEDCQKITKNCTDFFMMMPIKKPQKAMRKMGMMS